MHRQTVDMRQLPHESTNVTVSCTHEGVVLEHKHDRAPHNGVPHELTFAEAIKGVNHEENTNVEAKTISEKVEKPGNNPNSAEDDEEITRRFELHLQLVNSMDSSAENNETSTKNKGLHAKISDDIDVSGKRRQSKRASLSESSNKFTYRRNKSESPKKYQEQNNKTKVSELPRRASVTDTGNHDQYLRPRTVSARDRSWSGGSRSNIRRPSAGLLKPLKEQNNTNVNTKHFENNVYLNTPKSPRIKRKSIGSLDYSNESGTRTNTRLNERRHSVGHALLSQNKKENEQRPVTAATTSSKASSTRSRRCSIPQGRFTRQELDHYLPRKSFFDCHEKKLKETEDSVEDQYAKLRKKRQSAFDRVHGEELKKFESNAAITKLGVSDKLPNIKINENNENESAEKIEINPITLVSTLDQNSSQQKQQQPQQQQQQQQTTKPVQKKKSKKKYDDDDEITVDYSILVHYLKFIRDHPDEYIAGRDSLYHANHQNSDLKLDDSIIKMAHIFERGHHGEQSDGLLVKAVHEIRPQFFENVEASQNPEESKSEYEKHRVRVDKWIRSISTAQLNKAKELALRDMGDEDQAQTKWWLALKACHYIRHPEDPNGFRNPQQ